MPNRVSRRERRIRLYYLTAVIQRVTAAYTEPGQPPPPIDFDGIFAERSGTVLRWIQGREDIPRYISQLATNAYRVPPPPPPSRIPLLVGILVGVVVLGAAAVFWLGR